MVFEIEFPVHEIADEVVGYVSNGHNRLVILHKKGDPSDSAYLVPVKGVRLIPKQA